MTTLQAPARAPRKGAPSADGATSPAHEIPGDAWARVYTGDSRELLPRIPECAQGKVDLVFADPPFNWKRAYDKWDDNMKEAEYLAFTYDWLDLCIKSLRPGGSLWVNIPDDWAAEIMCYMKGRLDRKPAAPVTVNNWCIWHYRFGQNTTGRFINSKVHVLWFIKGGAVNTWNPAEILEVSDRRSIYFDPRTETKKDGMPAGMRVPMDVWYGQYWGRVQGNNTERRGYHDNQLPEVYLERVIRATSNEGDLVIDPFLGSGTTGVIAHALKRRFIGCEFSEDNAKSAFERMKAGPIRLGAAKNQSTAIFKGRKVGDKKKAQLLLDAATPLHKVNRKKADGDRVRNGVRLKAAKA